MDLQAVYSKVYAATEQHFALADGCHDFDHTRRVIANAMQLCDRLPEADREIVRFAALLHDIARAEEDRIPGGPDHALRGAAMVPDVLAPYGLPEEWIRRVAEAVRTHRYRDSERPASLEAEIVFDADKLDSLGAIGIGRAFIFAGKNSARLHNDARTALMSPAGSREDTAYREYLVKLRHLPEAVLTEPAAVMARKRADFMKTFFQILNEETNQLGESIE